MILLKIEVMIMMLNKKNLIDYYMIISLIFISGNLLFINKTLLFLTFFLSFLLFYVRKAKLNRSFIYFLILIFIIILLQAIKFNFFPIETTIGIFMRILIAYFILKSIGMTFVDKFIKTMYYISLSSLIVYLSILIIPGLEQFLINNLSFYSYTDIGQTTRINILGIYTIIPDSVKSFKANSGAFWEPGAYGGYLIIALIFSLIKNNKLRDRKNYIFIITILTTQSTTSYIALAALLFIMYSQQIKNILFKIIIIITILSSSYYAYNYFDFLGEKIKNQLYMATLVNTNNLADADTQRFINILKDWNDFQGHEVIGRGSHSETRYSSVNKSNEIRTVGSTDMILRFGLPFFILILYLIYTSFTIYFKYLNKINNILSLGMVIVILILLMSETYFLYPLFWILILLQYQYKDIVDYSIIERDK